MYIYIYIYIYYNILHPYSNILLINPVWTPDGVFPPPLLFQHPFLLETGVLQADACLFFEKLISPPPQAY